MSSEIRVMSPKIFSQVIWNAEYVARNFILLKNILVSLLHIYCTCSVPSKIKECDKLLIDLTRVSLLIDGSSVRYITFILLVSSHHPFKNNVCYTFIPLVLSPYGLKNKIHTLYSTKNNFVSLCTITCKNSGDMSTQHFGQLNSGIRWHSSRPLDQFQCTFHQGWEIQQKFIKKISNK